MNDLVIPKDFEAEQAVLGAIILDNKKINEIAEIISEKSFYGENHRSIFKAMLELNLAKQPIDEITLGDQLKAFGRIEAVGGYAYLAELVDSTPSAGNMVYYAKIIQEHELLRDLISTTSEIAIRSRDPKQSISQLLLEAENKIRKIAERRNTGVVKSLKEILVETFDNMEKLSSSKIQPSLMTEFTEIDKLTGGLYPGDLIIVAARPAMGKGLGIDEKILMYDGSWKKNRDLSIGDKLASFDGKENMVTGVFPKGEIDFYRVTFRDGRYIDCDNGHKWTIARSKWGHKRKTVDILTLKKMVMRCIRYKGRIYTEPMQGDFGLEQDLGIHPWVLGALLGDGCFSSGCLKFTNSEDYMLEKMKKNFSGEVKKINRDGNGVDYRLTFNRKISPELKFIRECGLANKRSHEKFIPDVIYRCSRQIREQVLAGLLETDGWVEKKNAFLFSSSSEQLRDDVANLVYSLGGTALKTKKENVFFTYKGKKNSGLEGYKLCINLANFNFIESPRIMRRLKQHHACPYPKIMKVERIGKQKSQCISVSHESGLFCTRGYIMTHNSAFALNITTNVGMNPVNYVIFYSLEMQNQKNARRVLASHGGLNPFFLKTGKTQREEDWDDLARAADRLSLGNVLFNDRTRQIDDIVNNCHSMKRRFDIKLAVVDYLQKIEGSGEKSREQEVSHISGKLKNLAMDLNIPVIAVCQLNRLVEARNDKRPQSSDLKDSGSIEADADVIIFIYRDEFYNQNTNKPGIAEFILAKVRDGPTGLSELRFDGKHTRFLNK